MSEHVEAILAEPNLLDVVIKAQAEFGYLPEVPPCVTAESYRGRLKDIIRTRTATEADQAPQESIKKLMAQDEYAWRVLTAAHLIGRRFDDYGTATASLINDNPRAQELGIRV